MSYCTVSDVVKAFPGFQRNAAGSLQDIEIDGWIDNWAGRIAAALAERGLVLATFEPSDDQTNFLKGLNEDGAVGDMASALQTQISTQSGEIAVGASRGRRAEATLKKIAERGYDKFFGIQTSASFGGIGGAEGESDTISDTPGRLVRKDDDF